MNPEIQVKYLLNLLSIVQLKMSDNHRALSNNEVETSIDNNYIKEISEQFRILDSDLRRFSKNSLPNMGRLLLSEQYAMLIHKYLELLASTIEFLLCRYGGLSIKIISNLFSLMIDIDELYKLSVIDTSNKNPLINDSVNIIDRKASAFFSEVINLKIQIDIERRDSDFYFLRIENNKKIDVEIDSARSLLKSELGNISKKYNESRLELMRLYSEKDKAVQDIMEKLDSLSNTYEVSFKNIDELVKVNEEKVESLTLDAKTKLEIVDGLLQKTSKKGMAAAFEDRRKALAIPMWFWIVVFFICLGFLTKIGLMFVQFAFAPDPGLKSTAEVISRAVVTLPLIWGAWFSAKQYSHISQLREDYAYKVAIAMTYHGYKDEAKDIHSDMSEKLLDSIVTQFADNPVRLYRNDNANSIVEAAVKNNKVSEIISALKGGK
ncbi:hypothetical protein N7319_21555 [Aeromonas dhakensis]|uniref:hypothetical protein n=1 Tax=Aeromonas TaxID=642 RepID=UPI0024481C61|nr:hypothetical protein [Aeromonas dhakensis]MDH0177780.1 hypothetical protein [Aeromonas dhakensis]HDZ8896385.1 hypothetical protein [Aeromonas dhakensis]